MRSRPARESCWCAAPGCWSAPGPSRCSSATCSRAGSAACPRPTGLAACGWTLPPRCWPEMARASSRADPARRAACDVLRAVAERDAYANLLLPVLLSERGLTGRDAALATELAYGALRGQGSYDAILAICSDRDLDRIDPPLRPVLRLGAHQLLPTRVEAHAAGATPGDLARGGAGAPPARVVNAGRR